MTRLVPRSAPGGAPAPPGAVIHGPAPQRSTSATGPAREPSRGAETSARTGPGLRRRAGHWPRRAVAGSRLCPDSVGPRGGHAAQDGADAAALHAVTAGLGHLRTGGTSTADSAGHEPAVTDAMRDPGPAGHRGGRRPVTLAVARRVRASDEAPRECRRRRRGPRWATVPTRTRYTGRPFVHGDIEGRSSPGAIVLTLTRSSSSAAMVLGGPSSPSAATTGSPRASDDRPG